jgi:hypothetical protein
VLYSKKRYDTGEGYFLLRKTKYGNFFFYYRKKKTRKINYDKKTPLKKRIYRESVSRQLHQSCFFSRQQGLKKSHFTPLLGFNVL